MDLKERSDPKFRHLVGKKIEFMSEGVRHVGVVDFIGVNTLLHNQFQITIDRTPIWPVDSKTIKLYTNK